LPEIECTLCWAHLAITTIISKGFSLVYGVGVGIGVTIEGIVPKAVGDGSIGVGEVL
jgi:hypothetical protein